MAVLALYSSMPSKRNHHCILVHLLTSSSTLETRVVVYSTIRSRRPPLEGRCSERIQPTVDTYEYILPYTMPMYRYLVCICTINMFKYQWIVLGASQREFPYIYRNIKILTHCIDECGFALHPPPAGIPSTIFFLHADMNESFVQSIKNIEIVYSFTCLIKSITLAYPYRFDSRPISDPDLHHIIPYHIIPVWLCSTCGSVLGARGRCRWRSCLPSRICWSGWLTWSCSRTRPVHTHQHTRKDDILDFANS